MAVIRCAAENGATAVQLREKNLSTKKFIELGKKAKDILAPTSTPLIINDRIDVAQVIQADGVHLGQTDMSYPEAREIMGKKSLIGLTVETVEEVQEAQKFDVDYLGLSALFATQTKPEANPYWSSQNIKLLESFNRHTLVGIGGINLDNALSVLNTGLHGIAISSNICAGRNLKEIAQRTRSLKNIINQYQENTHQK